MSARVDFAFLRAVRSPMGPSTASARAIATLLALRADNGVCYVDRGTIGAETRLGARTVRAAARELIEGGWAIEEHLPGQPRWTLQIPAADAPTATLEAQAGRRQKPRLTSTARREKLKLDDAKSPGLRPEKPRLLLSGSTPKTTPRETPPDQTREDGVTAKTPELPKAPPIAPGTQVALPGLEAPKAKPVDPLQAPEVTEVLEHWRSRGYHTRPVGDLPAYRKRVRDRLDEAIAGGIPLAVAAETLKAAIDGASIDDWLMGRHERNNTANGGKVYKGIDTILRDAAQVEKLATLWDVALAEGRAHPDGGDRHYDRFGNPRSGKRFQYPESSGDDEPIGAEETDRRFAAMAAESEAREQRVRDEEARIEADRRAALTPEIRAEEDMLRAVVERSRARMAEAEAREMN